MMSLVKHLQKSKRAKCILSINPTLLHSAMNNFLVGSRNPPLQLLPIQLCIGGTKTTNLKKK
jgi:hypothetical protein